MGKRVKPFPCFKMECTGYTERITYPWLVEK